MDPNPVTTADEVVAFFARSPRARSEFERWKRRLPQVAERVRWHRSEAVYQVSSESVRKLASAHPLGDVRPEEGYRVKIIRDWFPQFAFIHIFHFYLEGLGRIFSFEELRGLGQEEEWRGLLHDPAEEVLRRAVEAGYTREEARKSMQWRIGLAYYSFLREVFTVARLRELGLDMRVHPLADALFRADAWCGPVVLSLYVRNRQFRDGRAGRKPAAEELLGPGRPDLRFVSLPLAAQRTWGRVHLPSEEEVQECAASIRRALA